MLKLLVIEDEVITATDLKVTLEKAGHRILAIAKTSQEAKAALVKELPDMLIIDVRLRYSELDGIEIAEEIKASYDIPFIFLTAHSETQTFERAKALEPAAYLLKPFRNRELVFQVELAYNHYMSNKRDDGTNPKSAESVFLPYEKGHQKIVKSDVLFLQASGAYVSVQVKNEKKPYLFSMHLGYLSQYFTSNYFYQISRSYIINLHHINRFDSDHIYFNGGEEKIPIPFNKKPELMKKLSIIKTP